MILHFPKNPVLNGIAQLQEQVCEVCGARRYMSGRRPSKFLPWEGGRYCNGPDGKIVLHPEETP